MHMEHIVTTEEDGIRADKLIEKLYKNINYSLLQKIFRARKVKVNGKKAKASDRIQLGDVIRIYANIAVASDKKSTEKNPEYEQKLMNQFKKMIVFENDDLIAINKPTKLAVQLGTKVSICVETFMKSYNEDCKLVHRLDKDTSGVLLIAKNQKTAKKLTALFRENKIKKTYFAVVDGKIKTSGIIDNYLEKSIIGNEEKIRVAISGQCAITEYQPIKPISKNIKDDNKNTDFYYTLLELNPQTGRKHQLRVHCAEVLKSPILGDSKYNKNSIHKELFLHAHKIKIEELGIEITAPLPDYFPTSSKS